MTLFPLIALILYHVLPDVTFPAQVALHLPPVTLVATDTLVPVLMLVLALALTEALVRRFALQTAAFVNVAPSTSLGMDTDATTKKKRVARTALAMSVGGDA